MTLKTPIPAGLVHVGKTASRRFGLQSKQNRFTGMFVYKSASLVYTYKLLINIIRQREVRD
jgi:hypothetical protein